MIGRFSLPRLIGLLQLEVLVPYSMNVFELGSAVILHWPKAM
jgi:hypothetical protein